MSDQRFVWFAPNAGNWDAFRIEHRVANALADAGLDVVMIQCDRVFDEFCQVMPLSGLTAMSTRSEKQAACQECEFAARLGRDHARYRTVPLSTLLQEDDHAWVDLTMAQTDVSNWESLVIAGLPVGRYASYTSMLHHKRPMVSDSPESWAEYRADLRAALLTSRALPQIVERFEPTHAVVYNALYPANRVFAEGMRAAGAVLLNLSVGHSVPRRFATLVIYDGIKASQTISHSTAFRESRSVPASAQEVAAVEEHVSQLMAGADPWVYSSAASSRSAASVRDALGLRPDSQVVTVITSSPDEERSSRLVDAMFEADDYANASGPAEFIAAVTTLAFSRPDVDFVFRLHPRLAANKRDSQVSPDLATIHEMLAHLPSNAVVNASGDGLSLYDLLLISSAAINHTSSAGLEFLTFGVPVIQYDPVRARIYPPEFSIAVPRDDAEAFSLGLDSALSGGFDLDRSIAAFRWYATMHVRSVVHLEPLDEVRGADSAAAPAAKPSARRYPFARFLPPRVKKALATRLTRRQRAADIERTPDLDSAAASTLLREIGSISGSGDVWEPFMVYPEGTDIASERELVAKALTRLRRRLALGDLRGVGAVGQPIVSRE